MIRVFVVAATPMMRAGLRTLLGTADITIVGEAAALTDRPLDLRGAEVLIVADSRLLSDGTDGLPGEVALIVLADDPTIVAILRGLGVRSWGIVPPDASTEDLHAAVMAVAHGFVVLQPALTGNAFAPLSPETPVNTVPLDEPLTGRELEVLELVSQGLSNKMIARRLTISEHTVKFHVSSIYGKLGANNRTDAVSRGTRYGLITL